jgi:hypothetical protein
MVALAAGSSSRSTEISYQTKITTVMLGRVDGFDQDEAESKRDERAVILRRLLASKCDTPSQWPRSCGAVSHNLRISAWGLFPGSATRETN